MSSSTSTTTEHDAVIAASARSYELAGEPILTFEKLNEVHPPLLVDVFLPRLRRLEQVETESTLDNIDVVPLQRYRELGLEIWVLVPLSTVGKAHSALRGTADRIQPWWLDSGSVRFGEPQIP